MREALSRLAARGLVDAIGMRGFRVKAISYDDLADIVRIRTTIEREALRLRRRPKTGELVWCSTGVGCLRDSCRRGCGL